MPNWTKNQEKVFEIENGTTRNLLVSAAAGSGKTAVLVEKVIRMIMDKDNPLDIDRLLLVTYTNAAAKELKDRILGAIEKAVEENPFNEHLRNQQTYIHNAYITTVHGFCLRLIKEYFIELNIDAGVRVMDEGEASLLKDDVLKAVIEDYYESESERFTNFVRQLTSDTKDTVLKDNILKLYEQAMNKPWPQEWLDLCVNRYDINSIEEFYGDPYFKDIINNYKKNLLSIDKIYTTLVNYCKDLELEKYVVHYSKEQNEVKEYVDSLLKMESVRDMILMAKSFKFPSALRKNKNEIDDKDSERIKKWREKVKKIIYDLNEFAIEDESKCIEIFHKCRDNMETFVDVTKTFMMAYKEEKLKRNLIDFHDFEHYAIELLVEKHGDDVIQTDIARDVSQKFDVIMIDEYQDSNSVQETILKACSGEYEGRFNRIMVGDVKQSIYSFRGSEPQLFIEKYNQYKNDSKNELVLLDQNFRSSEIVIDSCNYIFKQIMRESTGGIDYDDENRLYFGAVNPECKDAKLKKNLNDSSEFIVVTKEDEFEKEDNISIECTVVADKIQEFTDKTTGLTIYDKDKKCYRTARYSDIAVLVSTLKVEANTLSETLALRNIKSVIKQKEGYFDTVEVSTVLSYLKIIDNPLQDIQMAAVLLSPIGGITDKEISVLRAAAGKKYHLMDNIRAFLNESSNEEFSLNQTALSALSQQEINELKDKLKTFIDRLNSYREKVKYEKVSELISRIYYDTGYFNYISAMPNGAQRRANLSTLKNMALNYEEGSYKGLYNFVRYIYKMQKHKVEMGETELNSENDDAVNIMTMHKSKGLEYPIVIIPFLEKQFNQSDANAKVIIDSGMGVAMNYTDPKTGIVYTNLYKKLMKDDINKSMIQERIRLLYVACTRAREKLVLIAGQVDNKNIESMLDAREEQDEYIGYDNIIKSKSMFDFVKHIFGRNKICEILYEKMDIEEPKNNPMYRENSNFSMSLVWFEKEVQDKIKAAYNEKTNMDKLLNLREDYAYDEEFQDKLQNSLEAKYEFSKETYTHAKMSVSEIKKIGLDRAKDYSNTEEYDEDSRKAEDEETSISTSELKGKQLIGALRGTAYHNIFEKLDYSKEFTKEYIEEVIKELVANNKIDTQVVDSIKISDFVNFDKTDVAKRMRKAHDIGRLYRETQFVAGVKEGELKELEDISLESGENENYLKFKRIDTSGDSVIIQGIIDAWYVEDGEIVIVDYKTDKIKDISELKRKYYVQLELYALAVENITGYKVKEKVLYSVRLCDSISW